MLCAFVHRHHCQENPHVLSRKYQPLRKRFRLPRPCTCADTDFAAWNVNQPEQLRGKSAVSLAVPSSHHWLWFPAADFLCIRQPEPTAVAVSPGASLIAATFTARFRGIANFVAISLGQPFLKAPGRD